jgi:hypothetical protein
MNSNINQPIIDSKYECSICQNILTSPHQITTCNHIFCKECIDNTIEFQKSSPYSCPLCKTNFTKKQLKEDKNLSKEINSTTATCTCSTTVSLSKWNDHTSSCKVYLGEINDNIKQTIVKDVKSTVNRSTFNCSICDQKNLDREALIKHVAKNHKNIEAVCPICICQPWGDPSYITHLHGHLAKRHKFDYDTTVDYNEQEDDVLQRVLMESMMNN